MTAGVERALPRAPEVVTLGECLVAFVALEPGPLAGARSFDAFVAGAEANVAVGLARLGRRAAFIGRVGDDALGTRIVRALRGEGVDVTGLTVDPSAPTGLLVRERRVVGPAEVFYARTGSAGSRLRSDDILALEPRSLFTAARWLHLTGITPALSADCHAAVLAALELARAGGLTISLDVNLRRRLWDEATARTALAALAGRVDVIIADEDEATVVSGAPRGTSPESLADRLLALGPRSAVLKCGALGALAIERGGTVTRSPGLAVAAVLDPVGAGDGFCAGFIDARLDGLDMPDALARANACGAAAVGAEGDQTGLPSRAELERLLRSGPDTLR